MGRGYSIWLPFIHGASIFKLLYSWLLQLYGGDEQFYQTILKALIHILTTSESSSAAQNFDSISTLSVAGSSSTIPTSSSTGTISRKSSSSALNQHTNNNNSPLTTLLNDLNSNLQQGSRDLSQIERKCSLELLRNLLSFKPIIFKGHEQVLVEILMKLVSEPTNPIFEELTSIFGTISLHAKTQRLAVSLNDNSIAVYDLRSGSRLVLLQGHVHPCTLVAFNTERIDGKQIISYSADEACVRWWLISSSSSSNSNGPASTISGIFSSLTGGSGPSPHDSSSTSARPGLKPVKVIIVQPELTEAIDCIPNGSVFKMNPINLSWNLRNQTVEFRIGASLIQTFSIPK